MACANTPWTCAPRPYLGGLTFLEETMKKDEWNVMWTEPKADSEQGDAHQRHAHGHPDPVLVEVAMGLKPGRSLDLGCGLGSNVIWLAKQGWDATGVDFSDVAIERAKMRAKDSGAHFVVADLRDFDTEERYDLVTLFYVHFDAEVFDPLIRRAAKMVKEGGQLLFVGHDKSASTQMAEHVKGHNHGGEHSDAHDHGHKHQHGHAHDHGHTEDTEKSAQFLAMLTTPEQVTALLDLTLIRSEVALIDSHGNNEPIATTVVLAKR